ncbi:MAG: NUDIX hydrolase [Gammaproteobacteria bacterium]|nr:NUDIX hydrolase [Gammaproteobacteria bacterium]
MTSAPEILFEGGVVRLAREWLEVPDGRLVATEVVRHPGGAVALPFDDGGDDGGRVLLLRQYRPCIGTWLWELPAGKLDPGESPEDTARRELAEEAGLVARSWRKLGEVVTAPGFCDEVLHLYLARDLTLVAADTEDDEYIETHWMGLDQALALADSGEIRDAKTLVALYRCRGFGDPGERRGA